MTPYEICMVSVFGFVALLLLVFVIVLSISLVSLNRKVGVILQDVAHKLDTLDPAFHLLYRLGAYADEKAEEFCERDKEQPSWLQAVVQLASLAAAGAGIWKNYRNRGR
ncbi:MAG: hypothetical protein JSS62_00370 [Verrucomicrobia bacterium]|nr:hypothetical protein [Verrucomicrobiota bacterium]MBS0646588.1 hypothetical protein [Verrucomicrobiota bacterium]